MARTRPQVSRDRLIQAARSVLAVLAAGFATLVVTVALHDVRFDCDWHKPADGRALVLVFWSWGGPLVGGCVAAAVAGRRGAAHALAAGAICLALLLGALGALTGVPGEGALIDLSLPSPEPWHRNESWAITIGVLVIMPIGAELFERLLHRVLASSGA